MPEQLKNPVTRLEVVTKNLELWKGSVIPVTHYTSAISDTCGYVPFDEVCRLAFCAEAEIYPMVAVTKSMIKVKNRNKEKIVLGCVNVECTFACNAWKDEKYGFPAARITVINLLHTCCSAISMDEKCNGTNLFRQRNPKFTHAYHASQTLKGFEKPINLAIRTGITTNQICTMVADEKAGIHFSKAQAKKFISSFNHDTFEAGSKEFSQLPSFLKLCQDADPEGFYYLSLKPLAYPVNNVVDIKSKHMFEYFIIIPSATRKFFATGNRVLVIDGCHMYSKWDGILLAAVGFDGEHQNVVLALALVPIENKHYWEIFFHSLTAAFSNIHMVISDKAKGLQSIRHYISATAGKFHRNSEVNNKNEVIPPTVYALCSLHCKRNSKFKGLNSDAQFNGLARAATIAEFNIRFDKLKQATKATPKICEYIEEHKDDFTYVGLAEKQGLKTNYGQVSSNPVEQCNAHMKNLRSCGPVTLCRNYLLELGARFTERHRQAQEFIDKQKLSVVPHALSSVKASADRMKKNKWNSHIQNILQGYDEAGVEFQKVTYVVSLAQSAIQFVVQLISLPSRSRKWFENVLCDCNYTLANGYPCRHASLCLVYPKLLDRNNTVQIASLFRYDLSRWYSPVYHTNVMLEQYNKVVISPTVTELISYEIYSPNILKSAGNDIFYYLPPILELFLKLLYNIFMKVAMQYIGVAV